MKMIRNILLSIAAILIICLLLWSYQTKHNRFLKINSELFKTSNGWGYNIKLNDKIYIHQESIPAVDKSQPFQSISDAEKVSKLIIHKIKNKKRPYVTKNELDSLKIHYQIF